MRVLISSVPLMGHLNPILSIGRGLVNRGHEVIGLSARSFQQRVEAIGATFRAFEGNANRDLSNFVQYFPEISSIPPGVETNKFYFERVFADPMLAQYASVCKVLDEFPVDLIVSDNLFFGLLPLLLGARKKRPPIAYFGITFLLWHRADEAPCNMALPLAAPGHYNELAAEVKATFDDPYRTYLNNILAKTCSSPLNDSIFDSVVHLPDLHLQTTVPQFEYPRSDMPDSVRFIGAIPIVPKQAPLPDWAGDLDGSKKVVLVSQGTLSNFDFTQLIRPTLDALADDPSLLVVVTAGGRSVDDVPGSIPSNARIASYLPFEWLLPRVDVFVTNGGYGSVNQALSYGVPIVGAGNSEDKAEVNARVAWAGVGIDLQTNTPTVMALRDAVRKILSDARYRAKARELALEYRRHASNGDVVQILESMI
ncbi:MULTISPECIES: glycosyltransferase [Burkholderiaceae]|uniref:UDP-glucosyltransferase n=1 Tax=Caballeronia zhejiangensis TaxID=871203 RepID=A0A656Q9Z3_9BURK|nr:MULTISPECIES: nucleotide disphospho-sugar-binding domain-containing protein [Burkholderiaceae]KAK43812.1 UDP-glucosyltransferase [Caballeronia jiangsuensis]KDR25861.1 UDP-glucosyltransferase [Caballeronia zhejiangensis]KWU23801.1 UDP-glucosyltransferase [Burkholderia cenocepacia]SAL78243.1 UDP-glucuronosyl/UDP-glucosyltransferase [Caballeronia peredens]